MNLFTVLCILCFSYFQLQAQVRGWKARKEYQGRKKFFSDHVNIYFAFSHVEGKYSCSKYILRLTVLIQNENLFQMNLFYSKQNMYYNA